MKKYDYVIVGSGLFAGTFAYLASKRGKKCLVVEKRDTMGGNLYCQEIEGIHVHKYGAHIFHTSNKKIWDFVNSLVEFNRFTNSPIANYKGEIYNLPFNMNTFHSLWGTKTPEEARQMIESQKSAVTGEPQNWKNRLFGLWEQISIKSLSKGIQRSSGGEIAGSACFYYKENTCAVYL